MKALFCGVCMVACHIGSAMGDIPTPDARLAKQPIIAAPLCGSPSPYVVENWSAEALQFVIVLKEGIPSSAAQILAVKHHFALRKSSSPPVCCVGSTSGSEAFSGRHVGHLEARTRAAQTNARDFRCAYS